MPHGCPKVRKRRNTIRAYRGDLAVFGKYMETEKKDIKPAFSKPEIKNNKKEVPLAIYREQFAAIDPKERAEILNLRYEGDTFYLRLLNTDYRIHWPDGRIESDDPGAVVFGYGNGETLLLRYLMFGQVLPYTGQYKTFRELPWGEVYIKPYTGRCITRLAFKGGMNPELFGRAAELLGGRQVPHGDAGYEFDYTGEYRLQAFVWQGDEEFPPSSQILFSDNFAAGFAAEDSVVAAEALVTAISRKMDELKRQQA